MTNVVKLDGVTLDYEPDPHIIAELERLLARAKDGDLRAIAYATCNANGSTGSGWEGVAGTRLPLGAAVAMLQHRYTSKLMEPA